MSQSVEAHEESEVVTDMSRLLRTAGMAGMQLSESIQRRRQHRERMEQAQQAEIARQTDTAVANVARNAHSKQFWQHAGNRAIAENVLTAQQLGARGNTQANNAYMLMADTIRDRYGLSVEPIVRGATNPDVLFERLWQGLDDHNQRGRELDELRAEHERQLDDALEATAAKNELYAAAGPEAEAAGMDVDVYLQHLGEEGQAALLEDARRADAAQETLDSGTRSEKRAARDELEDVHASQEERMDAANQQEAARNELREAAAVEARMANSKVDVYLDSLSEKQRAELLDAHRHPAAADETRDLEAQKRAERVTAAVTAEAAEAEARAHGVSRDEYLAGLSPEQKDQMVRDRHANDTSPEATERLEKRMESVNAHLEQKEKTLAEARAATSPEARREAGAEAEHARDRAEETRSEAEHESDPRSNEKAQRAEVADAVEDASRGNERLAERQEADQFSAERQKPSSAEAHDAALDRHLDKAFRTDQQAGAALRRARETTPNGGRDHLQRSSKSKVTPSKARGQKQQTQREHVKAR